jgi:hypothetical protein
MAQIYINYNYVYVVVRAAVKTCRKLKEEANMH